MDAPQRTSQGFLRAPAHLTRAGVFTYYNADGTERREYRPSAEVFKSDSLASLISAPVTDRHPPAMVTSKNRQDFDRGNVGESIVRDGARVAATLYIKDGRLISSIERGDMAEVSCGYLCQLDMTPGVVPDGEPDAGTKYDAVQSGIDYNHVAIVPRGRAGSEVRVHLDAAGDVVFPHFDNEDHMKTERIDGVDYEIDTPAHRAACERRDAATKAAKTEHEKLQARADVAEGRVKELEGKLATANDPASLHAAVTARIALVESAKSVLGDDVKFDAMTDRDVKLAVLASARPELKLDGKSDDYIAAAFEVATLAAREDAVTSAHRSLRAAAEGTDANGAPVEHEDDEIGVDDAHARSVKASREAWKKPIPGAFGRE